MIEGMYCTKSVINKPYVLYGGLIYAFFSCIVIGSGESVKQNGRRFSGKCWGFLWDFWGWRKVLVGWKNMNKAVCVVVAEYESLNKCGDTTKICHFSVVWSLVDSVLSSVVPRCQGLLFLVQKFPHPFTLPYFENLFTSLGLGALIHASISKPLYGAITPLEVWVCFTQSILKFYVMRAFPWTLA